MSFDRETLPTAASAAAFVGKVLSVTGESGVRVVRLGGAGEERDAVLLQAGGPPLRLVPGDEVVVLLAEEGRAIVLGRVGPSAESDASNAQLPDEIVLEARKGMTLRVGEGSITLRADGKILIKGKDLVSHARRMNRIRGGSVSLN
jgi:hypothetical protein